MENDYTIASVVKALKALKQFNSVDRKMTLTELSQKCGLTKSSMLRILASLEAEGFVKYDEETKKYRLGIEVFNLGNTAFEFLDIKKVAYPILKRAAAETKLLLHMAVVEDNKIIVIDKVYPTEHIDMVALVSYVGGSVPLHATGVGKVLTAYSSARTQEKLIAKCNFEKFTPKTLDSKEKFLQELDKVKAQGYAFNDCEHEPYLRCITRPVYNAENKVIAALSLSGLREVITDEKFEYYNSLSKGITTAVSREFGFKY